MHPLRRPRLISLAALGLVALPILSAAQAADPARRIEREVESTTAWQACMAQPDATRLACFDDWARQQQALISAIEEKARSVENSPTRNEAASAQAAAVRGEVAQALATAQPEPEQGGTLSGSAGIVGVGLEQGCRDRQFSELSRFWELESGSSCPTFGLRAFRPTTASVAFADHVNRMPTSPNPANSATTPIEYGQREMRLSLSVRTKLASGLLTPAGGTLRDSLWAAYTQQSNWQVFNSGLSRPFRNTDHLPELIYIYPTTLKLPGGWLWRFSGLGLAHQSNGQSDPLSRSWNRAYLMAGFEHGDRLDLQLRLWQRLHERRDKDNNPDITRYLGRGDLTLGWNIDARNNLRVTYSGLGGRRGSGRVEWTRSIGDGWGNSFSSLRLYTALFHGYGDSLLDYNFRSTVFSVGLSLGDF
ncbi:MAG TPA: phospholipase A [Ottowia sp.]|uniref:phospholipase A n=1 Tax=Ottowia sp. TaxID=1898956 RepID=UPI002BA3E61A|nr:phospholipase A [Ottowia sp.]HMN19952.1 phospholipase A [Ottowia sp.]